MNTVIVTGATSGIGLACVRLLTEQGFGVIGMGRSAERCKAAQKQVLEEHPLAKLRYFAADLMQLGEINRAAGELGTYIRESCEGRLYALINNAGCARGRYTTTEDGYEQLFALNVLSGFLLTYHMLPYLKNAGGRVIMTGSGSHKGINVHWEDVMLKNGYNPLTAYKQSKLCNMLFALGLNERYTSCGVRAYVADPGLVKTDIGNKQTGGLVSAVWSLRKKQGVPPEIPAQTFAYLCGENPPPDGLYYYLCKEVKYSRRVTSENAERLFKLCEQLCGIRYN